MNMIEEGMMLDLMQDCRDNKVPCISPQTRELLVGYLEQYRPKYYLEIGCAHGVSLFTAHQHCVTRGGAVVGIERSLPNIIRVQQMIQDHGLTDIAVHHLNANHPGRESSIITQPIDLAFIDARKSNYHIYLQMILPYMAPDSVIICDDVIEFAPKLAPLYEFLEQNQMNYETIPLADGDGVCVIKIG